MLVVNSLSAGYHQDLILQNISFDIKSGEIMSVIGPNGSGKTTLIRAISGVIRTIHGTSEINNLVLSKLSSGKRARLLAVVQQARLLPSAFSVYQTVLIGRTPYMGWMGQAHAEDHHYTMAALEMTKLLPLADRLIGELSGGEQQRVLLARALAQNTPVLLLDEPTTHLDLEHQASILNIVSDLAHEHGIAVLIILHDLNLASLYSDKVMLLIAGRVHAIGTPQEVLTEQILESIYSIPVQVIPHPNYGRPLILPDGR